MRHVLIEERIRLLVRSGEVYNLADGRIGRCCSLGVYQNGLAFPLARGFVRDEIEVVRCYLHLSRSGFQASLAIIPIVGQHSIIRGVTTMPFTAYSEGLLIKLTCLRVNQPRSSLESDGTAIGALSTYQQARRESSDSFWHIYL